MAAMNCGPRFQPKAPSASAIQFPNVQPLRRVSPPAPGDSRLCTVPDSGRRPAVARAAYGAGGDEGGSRQRAARADPNQPIDEEYTRKIKEHTTETFFLSPLVDYLPASKTVPTPKAVLGDIAGAAGKLPYTKEIYDYMRLLAKSTPRVKVYSIGTSEEGREMIAVAVASEALMAKLDENKADLAKLADPRTIKMDDELADRIARRAAPVYYITGTIHSTEAGAPTALMELAYRLAVDDSAYVRNIREHVITLITPVVEPDGRDRVVDIYEWRKKHPKETPMSPIYWGHYVAHDNNRDAMALTLKLSQNVLNTYLGWKAQVLHDLHESGSFLYDNTIGNGPYNAWLDPILTNEWHLVGWNNVNEMTRMGMPGVYAWGTFDTWSPGYLMFMAATHNGISRLYETFGNSGSADTEERTLTANETSRTWFRQNPPISRVRWSLRNNNNYEQTGLLISLNQIASNRVYFLRNFYEKSKRSILKAKVEGPAAYVFPASDPRPGAQAELLRVLQKQAVEISRATSAFTVTLPARPAATGRGGRGGRGGGANAEAGEDAPAPQAPPKPLPPVTREFPAGSYIVRMDQPYSRIADALLDYQYWAPNDAQSRPYDDTGWTFPEGFAVQAVRVTDVKVLDVAMEPVKGDVSPPCGVTGEGSVFAINHNADNALITLRYRLKDADIQIAEEPFEAGGAKFARGSFVISNVSRADLDNAAQGARPQGPCGRGRALGQNARGPRRQGRHPARLGDDSDRGLVASGVRRLQDSLRLHRSADDPRHRKPAREVRRHRARSWRQSGTGAGAAAVAQPDPVSPLDRDAEHRHLGADRRHPHRHGAPGARQPEGVHRRRRRIPGVEQQRRVRDQQLHLRRQRQQARRQLAGGGIAAAHTAGGREEPAGLRHSRQPRDVQRQR